MRRCYRREREEKDITLKASERFDAAGPWYVKAGVVEKGGREQTRNITVERPREKYGIHTSESTLTLTVV